MVDIAWGAKVSQEFLDKVVSISNAFGWGPLQTSYLMSCIAFETGETFSPSIKNGAGSGATGLIQFMPRTAISLGTTVDALAKMSAVQQLDFVAAYFKPYAHRVTSLPDMYMAILMPKYVSKPDSSVLFSGGTAYRQNAGLDADKDGLITKREAAARVQSKFLKGMRAGNVGSL